MVLKDLGGHSGCKIVLCEDNSIYYVRKISSSREYNTRLVAQCEKQESFVGKSIKVPAVINKGYEGDLFFFDMEYIQGVTLAKYITKVDVSEIDGLVSKIIDNIEFSTNLNFNQEVFVNKVNDLKMKTSYLDNEILKEVLDFLCGYDWSFFSETKCHGDLTLENIIIRNGEIYYIDFLDSFYNSWLLDVGKLFQDVDCLWSYRNDNHIDMNLKIRLTILKELIIKKLNTLNSRYIKDVYVSLLLNLVRIYPYTSDTYTLRFLDKNLERIMRKVNVK